MKFLPVALNITNKKILVIGGGKVALHKIASLKQYTNDITIVAPEIHEALLNEEFVCIKKHYHSSCLEGYDLVYACTNNSVINAEIRVDAVSKGKLVNVADSPEDCDFVSPAIFKSSNISIAVSSNAEDVKKAIFLRDKIRDFILEKKFLA